MDFFTYRIVDERGSGGGNDAAPRQQGVIDKNNPVVPKGGGGISNAINVSTLQQMGRGATNLIVGHVGYFTGSSEAQDKVNAGAQLAGTVAQIINDPRAGLANLALQMATKAIELAQETRQERWTLNEATRRAGPSYNQNRR